MGACRPYQTETLEAIARHWRAGDRRQLVVLPTAAGKTVVAAHLPDYIPLQPWQTILFLVHMDTLAWQARDKLKYYNPGLSIEVEKAEHHADPNSDIVIASIQTLSRSPERLHKFNPDDIAIVVTDESHHSLSRSFLQVYEYLHLVGDNIDRSKLHLGITATPEREDNVGLEYVFDTIVKDIGILDLINDPYAISHYGTGWLASPRAFRVETQTELDKLAVRKGDFAVQALAQAVNTQQRNELVIQKYLKLGEGFPAIGFTADIAHADDLAEVAKAYGVKAAAISGKTSERDCARLKAEYDAGDLDALFSCQKLIEGFDSPRASVALMARPILSTLLYRQAVGRVLRPYPAPEQRAGWTGWVKPYAIVIDYCDSLTKHSLIGAATLVGLPPKFDAQGAPLAEVAEQVGKLVLAYPALSVRERASLSDVKAFIESVDLFRPPEVPKLIKRYSKLAWLEEADKCFRLATPDKTVLRLRENKLGQWEVHQGPTAIGAYPHLKEAVFIADALVPKKQVGALLANARWRKDPPTENQCKALYRADRHLREQFAGDRELFRFACSRTEQGDPTWSKGGLSRRLDVVLHRGKA